MTGAPGASEFLSLIRRFLAADLGPEDFCAQFTAVWMKERDAAYARSHAWPEPYDKQLRAAWQRGEVSEEELHEGLARLFGYDLALQRMVDGIHSACSVFYPEPEGKWQIGEEHLRHDVEKALVEYVSAGRAAL